MPSECRIQLFPKTITSHKCFCSTTFFSRASVKDHCSGNIILFQICLNSKCSRKSSCSKYIVAAAMSVSTCMDLFRLCQTGLLRKSGKRIIFCKDSDVRASVSIRCCKSSLNVAGSTLYLKSLFFQCFAVSFRGFKFLKGKLRKLPDLIGNAGDQVSFVFNRLQCRLFFYCHVSYLLSVKVDKSTSNSMNFAL